MRGSQRALVHGFIFVARTGLGCMFLWSALPKIRQPYDFLSAVYGYELVGPKLGLLVAMTLPWMELLAAICLVGGIFVSGAFLASTGMATLFTLALASALYRGLDISCGCFAAATSDKISYLTLVRATAILLVSLVAYAAVVFLPQRAETKEEALRNPLLAS
jgi:hypothetical protein